MNDFNIEKYDKAVENMIKSDYSIPEDFDRRVKMTVNNLRPGSRILKYPIIAASLLIIVFLTINLIPSVATYASYIPGLNVVIDWLVIDKGEKNALEKGYPVIGPVMVQKEGYALQLEDIFIDDVCIRLSAKLTGKNPSKSKKSGQTEIRETTAVTSGEAVTKPEEEQYAEISFSLRSNGFNHILTAFSCGSENAEVIAQEIRMYFDDKNTLADFLDSKPEHLSFDAVIYKDGNVDCEIKNILVPIDREKILLSRHYNLSETVDFKHADVSFRHFQVSPIRMTVEMHFSPKDSFYIQGWANKWLKDSLGNIYESSGESGWAKDGTPPSKMDVMYCYFIPSFYFEHEMPEKLYFCYDGYRIGSLEGTAFTLDINDEYPKSVKFLGEDITIENLIYHDDNTLEITMKLPALDVMSNTDVISPDIIFVDSSLRSVDMHIVDIKEENSKRYTLYIKDLSKKDSYKIDLWGAGYYIDKSGEIEIVSK